ncbi:MAG TPA: hypothetical protein DD446_11245 [Coprococcus sp.]|nr:hypothetical protein DWW60_00555 [Coprococcus sp. AF16-22]RHR67262.1 hypothetical protein DWW70_02240 [Coprococcus sp. AF16-5]HAQ91625.1 hypothetical protein [Coprococcus sp.]HAX32511.1 hypothetical protein [Coprococcus sp.]HBN41409.1 hypothetical protein [Coprococcus sp.]
MPPYIISRWFSHYVLKVYDSNRCQCGKDNHTKSEINIKFSPAEFILFCHLVSSFSFISLSILSVMEFIVCISSV